MGKLLFVKTSRTYGIFGLIVCCGAIVAGAWMALSGTYAGILLVPLGLLCGKFCLKMATLKFEIYEQGFFSKSIFGTLSSRYADLTSIARGATRTNGVLMTNIHFATKSGAKATITSEGFGKDDKMAQLLNHACHALATTWTKTLERQSEIVWMSKGSSPTLKIRKDGVLVKEKTGVETFIPLSRLHVKSGFALSADIFDDDKKIVKVNTGSPNYFVGETLIAMLLQKQGG
jgi:hypothetical protein